MSLTNPYKNLILTFSESIAQYNTLRPGRISDKQVFYRLYEKTVTFNLFKSLRPGPDRGPLDGENAFYRVKWEFFYLAHYHNLDKLLLTALKYYIKPQEQL